MEVLGTRGLLQAPLLLLAALLHLLLLALAGGAEAWAPHGHGAVGFAGGERRYRDLAAGRMASVRSSFGSPRRGLATSSASRVYHVTDYGADPTGAADATAAIKKAIADAFSLPSNATLTAGIPDLGGAEIHLDGGTYLVNGPLTLPASGGGNFKIHSGSLRASAEFPTDRYLIELSAGSSSSGTSAYHYEFVTLRDLMLDCSYQVHRNAPYMVFTPSCGGPRPLYGGVYTAGGHSEGYFYHAWMAA